VRGARREVRGARRGKREAGAGSGKRKAPQSAVSRILFHFRSPCGLLRWMTIIPLAPSSLTGSSSLPGDVERAVRYPRRPLRASARCVPLFGLAPCGVLPAIRVATDAVRSYRTFSPLPAFALRATARQARDRPASPKPGGRRRAVYFLCHWSFGLPRPGVTRRTALRSSDFPPVHLRSCELANRRSSGALRPSNYLTD
jgi:hypothetical protein